VVYLRLDDSIADDSDAGSEPELMSTERTERRCCFCDRPQSAVGLLIGYSKHDAAICNDCTLAVVEAMFREFRKARRPLQVISDSRMRE
jgi:hypothetical protein